jgi:hypothetical protein
MTAGTIPYPSIPVKVLKHRAVVWAQAGIVLAVAQHGGNSGALGE